MSTPRGRSGVRGVAGRNGKRREDDRAWEFVQMLRRLAGVRRAADGAEMVGEKNRGALAALRRGLGRPLGTAPEMYPYVVPYLPEMPSATERERRERERVENAYFLIAALFARHPMDWPTGASETGAGEKAVDTNFGASMRRLADAVGSESIERRFVAVLNAHREDLPEHLRHAIGLLESKGVPVNWTQLLRDVLRWDDASRVVQRSWSRSYWRAKASPSSSASALAAAPAAARVRQAAAGDDVLVQDARARSE